MLEIRFIRCLPGVAPLAGAWIEIPNLMALLHYGLLVAPLAGAWIEIEQSIRTAGYK